MAVMVVALHNLGTGSEIKNKKNKKNKKQWQGQVCIREISLCK